jgi:Holliday junction resolvase RusA-like endonuclease
MPEFRVTIPGQPAPKSLNTGGKRPKNNPKVRSWMDQVRDNTFVAMRKAGVETVPAGVPIRVLIICFFPWPKNTPQQLIDETPYAPCLVKPDWDNVGKPICDGITEAGLWEDDNQVWRGAVETRRCPRGEEAAEVVVAW